jgi:dishevelled associated activator of morphogenesis
MIEQLLKFIPTMEEFFLLEENRSELANMTKADRFLYDMSKVFRYKQKLESLYFKKKYAERQRELSAKLTLIIDCCKRLRTSQSLVSFLEIVLALGNFMNQSHRKGVALGFSIANLNKLIDIKSSNDRSFSFLHFLINTIQEKVRYCHHIF